MRSKRDEFHVYANAKWISAGRNKHWRVINITSHGHLQSWKSLLTPFVNLWRRFASEEFEQKKHFVEMLSELPPPTQWRARCTKQFRTSIAEAKDGRAKLCISEPISLPAGDNIFAIIKRSPNVKFAKLFVSTTPHSSKGWEFITRKGTRGANHQTVRVGGERRLKAFGVWIFTERIFTSEGASVSFDVKKSLPSLSCVSIFLQEVLCECGEM